MLFAAVRESQNGAKIMLTNHPKLKSVLADHPKAREKLIGAFIWLTFAVAGIAIIYWFSRLAGD